MPHTKDLNKQTERWMRAIILSMWEYSKAVWKHRNEMVHGTQDNTMSLKECSGLQKHVKHYYKAFSKNRFIVPNSRIYLFDQPMVVTQSLSWDALIGWIASVQEAVDTQRFRDQKELEGSSSLLHRWLSQGPGRVWVNNTMPTKYRSRGRVRRAIPTQPLPAVQNLHNKPLREQLPTVHSGCERKPGHGYTVGHQPISSTPGTSRIRQGGHKVTSRKSSATRCSKGAKAVNQRTQSQTGLIASGKLLITRAQVDKELQKVDFSGSLLSTVP
jgi:hypothetical protein